MDGNSFDRLSVVVHGLRDQATRRNVLRLLFGGSLAAAMGSIAVAETEGRKKHKKKKRKKKKHKKCRGFGGRCSSGRHCCSGNCINGFCFGGGGKGGKNKKCGNCPSGWSCCRSAGVSVCVPNNYPTCCGGNSFVDGYHCCGGSHGGACPSGWDCCGGFGQCCSPGWKCCGNGRCCPDGWHCGDFTCEAWQESDVSGESVAETMPFREPETIPADDWISLSES